jgi:phosphate-selective porin OprO and OprP
VLASVSPSAQSVESDTAPVRGQFEAQEPLPPAKPSIVPDIPTSFARKTQIRTRWFTLKPGLVLIEDYSAFTQDAASISQIGAQEDQWDPRSGRLMLSGTIGDSYKVRYLVAGEYKGFDSDPEETWQVTDVSFTFTIRGPATKLTVGKTKQTFAYEMVGDAANLPQAERVLSPFFVSRDIGVKVSHVFGKEQRATAAVGVFNDWWVRDLPHDRSGTDITARVTGLLWDDPDRHAFFHVGLAGRRVGADDDTLRYKGRPESNVTDNYVDTGNLVSDHASHLGLEALWNEGPFSLLAEYNRAWVDSPDTGDPQFFGYYLTASWVLTGETRPYDRTVGFARRVLPQGSAGAPELVFRFSHVDLDDQEVSGGSFDKTYLGINWWATRRAKIGFGWGHTILDRFATTGHTDSFQTRLQFIF